MRWPWQKKSDVIWSLGGYCAPTVIKASIAPGGGILTAPGSSNDFRLFLESFPSFSAARGGIDFTPPHVRWAKQREREMRLLTKMWDWP